MPRTRCPHCGWKGDVDDEFIGIEVECPECEEVFLSKRLKKKKKPPMQQSGTAQARPSQPPSVPQAKPPKTLFVRVWLWIYVVLFTIAAISVAIMFANLVHEPTGEKRGLIPGLCLAALIESFAVGFAAIAIGLKKEKSWAFVLAVGFLAVNVSSPMIIFAVIGLIKLLHEDTRSVFLGN
jgi:hypothetical protein